ncbi:YdcF family protein [Oceaniglobus roseus]|uniref:YdcF family protein n=1 Tax=Oceaniglobus roseus TaxID=1737570 RepID=UPI0012FFEDDA|nr:YdcF family protein [Kandeliimicrobium roseum]
MSTLFFIASKIVGLLIRGETWLVLLLALALLGLLLNRRRLAGAALALALAAVLVLTALPVGPWAMRPLERQYPFNPPLPAPPDGIIVLGGAVEAASWKATGQVHLNDAGERLTEAAVLARRFPEARLILSGGGATLAEIGGAIPSEAAAMAALLTGLGIDPARLTLEEESRNTIGNATYSFDIVQPQEDQTWLLVTSASHMPRAVETFARAGWTGIVPWPVDLSTAPGPLGLTWDLPWNLYYLNRAVKEYVGLVAYRLAAR